VHAIAQSGTLVIHAIHVQHNVQKAVWQAASLPVAKGSTGTARSSLVTCPTQHGTLAMHAKL
jgi:hypothetical protein